MAMSNCPARAILGKLNTRCFTPKDAPEPYVEVLGGTAFPLSEWTADDPCASCDSASDKCAEAERAITEARMNLDSLGLSYCVLEGQYQLACKIITEERAERARLAEVLDALRPFAERSATGADLRRAARVVAKHAGVKA